MLRSRTSTITPKDVDRKWYVIDVSEAPLGRVATKVARLLSGKGKPSYTPHIDNGDYVIIINADKFVVTGSKEKSKTYYRHSGYPGNLREKTLEQRRGNDSQRVIEDAVYGMLPKNKLRNDRMIRLKVYKGDSHNHEAQKPKKVEIS